MAQNTSMLHSISLLLLIAGILITLASKNIFNGAFGVKFSSIKDYITGQDITKDFEKKENQVVEEKEESVSTSRREIDSFDYNLFE